METKHTGFIVKLFRILPPLNKFECDLLGAKPEGGAISEMRVMVPQSVITEGMVNEDPVEFYELLDDWIEDEFGFPWMRAHEKPELWSQEQWREHREDFV